MVFNTYFIDHNGTNSYKRHHTFDNSVHFNNDNNLYSASNMHYKIHCLVSNITFVLSILDRYDITTAFFLIAVVFLYVINNVHYVGTNDLFQIFWINQKYS